MNYFISQGLRWGLILLLALAGWKVVPVYAAALRFNFAVAEASKVGATGRLPAGEVADIILLKARQLGLPVRPDDVEVQRERQVVIAQVAYQVPVDFGSRRVVLNFHARAREQPFIFQLERDAETQNNPLE